MNQTVGQLLEKGMQLHTAGQFQDAEIIYRKVLEIVPDQPDAIHFIGVLAFNVGKFDIAVDYISKAIEFMPENAACYNNLGNVYQQQGKFKEAIPNYEKTLDLDPNHFKAHNNLGVAYIRTGDCETAQLHCEKALSINPNYAGAYNNLGECHSNLGDYKTSLKHYEAAINLEPNLVDAHWNRSLSLLVQGQLPEGFAEYKWRWKRPNVIKRQIDPATLWDGGPLNGKNLLVFEEQGVGDVFQFIRYLPMLKQTGANVIFEASPGLIRLLSSLDYIDKLWVRNTRQDTYNIDRFDKQCALLDLPSMFRTEIMTIPSDVPYLNADPGLKKSWARRFQDSDALKIGIVWAGNSTHHNDFNRSCRLSFFGSLSKLEGVELYSIQKEKYEKWTDMDPSSIGIKDFTQVLHDFSDTAAFISHMDLIISVDTAVVHLAGAMAKNVWVLLPFNPDWRWLLNRSDCPWYPTMTLFRQDKPGDWPGVFTAVEKKLQEKTRQTPNE